jgi:hypothetical protein
MTDVDDAKSMVDKKRTQLLSVLPEVVKGFQEAVAGAIDQMVEQTVIKQPGHTASLDAAQLGVLKFNIAEAKKSALAGIEGIVSSINFDSLASRASRNMHGQSFVKASELLSGLLQPTGDLLQTAGYNVNVLKASSFDDGYRLESIRGVGSAASVAARRLDEVIERYGQAKIQLAEAETDAAQADARSAWDNA